jgi:hypothetical protein
MVEQEKYDKVVMAFDTLEEWAKNAKELLEKIRDDSKTDAGLAVSAKCLIWDWKGT